MEKAYMWKWGRKKSLNAERLFMYGELMNEINGRKCKRKQN